MALPIEVTRRRFTAEEYDRMAEAGILAEERVELIEGEIIQMAPIGLRHAACVTELTNHLVLRLAGRGVISPQNPLRLPGDNVPQPDIVVLRPPMDQYRHRRPQPADALLVVEVSDTTYRYDREIKLPLYARAGVAEAWILNLPAEAVEVYRAPGRSGYRHAAIHRPGASGAPEAFPDIRLTVDDILALPAGPGRGT